MGEQVYEVEGKYIRFSEDSEIGCLCTFPHNDRDLKGKLIVDKDRLLNLALLGCVVVLLHNTNELEKKEYIFIPTDIQEYYETIQKAIANSKDVIKVEEE